MRWLRVLTVLTAITVAQLTGCTVYICLRNPSYVEYSMVMGLPVTAMISVVVPVCVIAHTVQRWLHRRTPPPDRRDAMEDIWD